MRHPLSTPNSGGEAEGAVSISDMDVLGVQDVLVEAMPEDLEPAIAERSEGGMMGLAQGDLGLVELAGPARAAQRAEAHCWTASAR